MATITGTPNNDTLTGNWGDDIYGLGGHDTIDGGGGTLDGGDGDDYIYAEGGLILGGTGNDTLFSWGQDGTVLGGDGNDRISVIPDSNYIVSVEGGAGDDTIEAYEFSKGAISGGTGRDTFVLDQWNGLVITDFTAGPGGDILDLRHFTGASGPNPFQYSWLRLEQSGNDVLVRMDYDINLWVTLAVLKDVEIDALTAENFGGYEPVIDRDGTSDSDTLTGTALDDRIRGLAGNDVIYGLSGNDTLTAGEGHNTLEGDDGNDSLVGSTRGNDVLRGGAGDDHMSGVGGSDVLDGGDGWDVVRFAIATEVNLTTGRAVKVHSALGGTDTLLGFEELIGSVRSDTITGSAGADVIHGGGDSVNGGDADTVYGLSGNDRITANGLIHGGDGNDTLAAAMYAIARETTVYGGDGDDVITGSGWHDTLYGEAGSDSIDGSYFNDYINGGARWDTLVGGHGDDTLDGGADNDRMWGGIANDLYYVDHIGDRVFEDVNEGVDTVRASITYALTPNVENLQLMTGAGDIGGTGNGLSNSISGNLESNALAGGLGNDSLYGWAGNDALDGGADHDRLSGGDGLDTLTGGAGNDQLGGGAGADDFVFGSTATNGHDHIVDFQHGLDRLVFSGADYGFATGHVLTAAEFTAGTTAVGSASQFVWDSAGQHLYFDADGSGGAAAIELALISGGATVTREDLVFA